MTDMVNQPPHYTAGKVECLDAIEAALGPDGFRAYLRGQIIKYTWRGPHKGSEGQDYEKAEFYLNKLIVVTEEAGEVRADAQELADAALRDLLENP